MLFVLLGVSSIGSMGRYAVGPLSPFIIEHFALGKAQFGVLSSAIGLGGTVTSYAAGVLVDRLGVRSMILLSLFAVGAPLALFFLPVGYAGAALLLLLSGAGFSSVSPLCSNGTANWFPRTVRGLTVGVTQAGIPLGIAVAALVLPRLALAIGWGYAMGLLGLFVFGAGVLFYVLYQNGPLVSVETRVPDEPRSGSPRPSLSGLLGRGDGLLSLYVLGLVLAMSQNAFISFLVPFLQDRWALPVVTAGTLLSLSQLAGMGARPLVGYVSDRFVGGRRKEVLAGIALLASGSLVLLALSPTGLPGGLRALLIVLAGMTALGWPGLFLALSLEKARPGTAGAASGLAIGVVMAGSLTGPALFGFLVDLTSYATGWVVLAAVLVMGCGFFLARFHEPSAGLKAESRSR